MNEEILFHEALAIADPQQRLAFLEKSCAGQADLRAAVEALLRASEPATSIIDKPAVARHPSDMQQPFAAEGPGSAIGPYLLIEQIGEGGFGIVFLAEQHGPIRRQVALKTIKPGMDSRQVIARFEAERQALAILDHANIAKVLDAGITDSGRPFFVMELVSGIPITTFCDTNQLTPRERVSLFVPVCQAIQHAHQKGIIHRDLKPTNVLVAKPDGVPIPKVIDFGVAKALGDDLTERSIITGLGNIVGTLEYMSPEQADFGAVDIDTRADIYSLGALLYELLTGSTPVTRQQLQKAGASEILRAIREDDPPRPSNRLSDSKDSIASISAHRRQEPARLTKELRGELDWIVMKCLEKDRNRRYATANGLVRDIERYLNDEPVEAGPPSATYRLRKLARKHHKLLVAVASFALLLAVAAIAGTWLAIRATRAERIASQERDRAVAEKQRADDESSIALAVNEFLQDDLLSQADVREQSNEVPRDKDITVRELLDRAALRIEGRFKDHELSEAAIQRTLGNAYRALGEYDKSQWHLERSRTLRQKNLGPDHPDMDESLNDLGLLEEARGNYERAESLLLQALKGTQARLGPEHDATRSTSLNLARLYCERGNYDSSQTLFLQLLENRPAGPDNNHYETIQCLTGLALVYQATGRYDDAEQQLQQALQHSRIYFDSDHPDTLTIMSNLGILHRLQGRLDDSQQMHGQALEGRRRILGPEHPETLNSLISLAALLLSRGQVSDAESHFTQALEVSQRVHGMDHPRTLAIMNNLGVVYRAQARYDESERMYRHALDERRRILGEDHLDTLATMNNLGALLMSRRKYGEAEELLGTALNVSRNALGPDHPQTIGSINSLATLYFEQRRYPEAESLFREALQQYVTSLGVDHPNRLITMSSLARLLEESGRMSEAEPLAKQAMDGLQKKLGMDHPATLNAMNCLGMIYYTMKNFKEAIPLLEETLARRRSNLGADHPHTLKTLADLGINYRDAGRIEDGVRCLEEALDIARKRPGPLPVSLENLPNRLAETYLRAGQLEKAESIYRELLTEARQDVGENHPHTAELMVRLGGNLVGQANYADAEPLLLKGYEILKTKTERSPTKPSIAENSALDRLIDLYDAWGKPDEAARWRQAKGNEPPE